MMSEGCEGDRIEDESERPALNSYPSQNGSQSVSQRHCSESESEANCSILPDVTIVSGLSKSPPDPTQSTSQSPQDRESQPLLGRGRGMDALDAAAVINNTFPDDPEYSAIVREAENAIENEVYPDRITQGSSGSYFVRNTEGQVRLV